jgi:hypothetical protein
MIIEFKVNKEMTDVSGIVLIPSGVCGLHSVVPSSDDLPTTS